MCDPPAENTSTILIIEDNRETAALMETTLSNGYSIYNVASGEAALTFLKNVTTDLVVLDLTLAGAIGGMGTLVLIKSSKDLLDIPVIVVSGTESTDLVSRAERLGAVRFIKKPYSPTYLRSEVERLTRDE